MSVGVAFPSALREAILAKNEDQINQTLTDEKVKKCFLDWAELHGDCFKHSSFLISLYNRAVIGEQRYLSYEPIKLKMNMPMDVVEGYYEAGLLSSAQTVEVHQVLRNRKYTDFKKSALFLLIPSEDLVLLLSASLLLPSEDLVHLLSATRESGQSCFDYFLQTNFPLVVNLLREKCSGEQIVQLFSLKSNELTNLNPIICRAYKQKEFLYSLLDEKCTAEQLIQLCSLRDKDNDPAFIYEKINRSIFPILKEKCTNEQIVSLCCLKDNDGMPVFKYKMVDEIPMSEKIVLILDAIGPRMDAPASIHEWLDAIFLKMKKSSKEEVLNTLKITGENGKSLIHIPYFFKKADDLLQEMCTWSELFDLLSIEDKQGNTPVLVPGVSHQAVVLMEQAEQKLKERLLPLEGARKVSVSYQATVSHQKTLAMKRIEQNIREDFRQLLKYKFKGNVSHQETVAMKQIEQNIKTNISLLPKHTPTKEELPQFREYIPTKKELSQLQDCKHTLEDHENQFGISLPIIGGLEEKPGSPSPIPTLRHLAYEQLNKMGNDVEIDNS